MLKKEVLFKKVADLEVKGTLLWDYNDSMYYRWCGFTGDAEELAVLQGEQVRYLHVFLINGSYNLNLAQTESKLPTCPNYKITVLAGTVSRVNFSLISPPARGYLVFQYSVLSPPSPPPFLPFLSSGRDLLL